MIKILITDDNRSWRESISAFLGCQPDMEVVGEAKSGMEAIELCSILTVDLVLMDLSMPGINGIEAARSIVKQSPSISAIAFTSHTEKHYLTEALLAGVKGYVVKDDALDELVDAIRSVVSGAVYVSKHASPHNASVRQVI